MRRSHTKHRSSAYTIVGVPPTEPPHGWGICSPHSPHGELLVEKIKSGEVNQDNKPADIWRRFPALRVVNPKLFRKFKEKCVREALRQAKAAREDRDSEDEDSEGEESTMSSDSESDSAPTTPVRMARRSGAGVQFKTTQARLIRAKDAPTKHEVELQEPLLPLSAHQNRHQPCLLPVRPINVTKTRALFLITMLHGQTGADFTLVRDSTLKCRLYISWGSSIKDEQCIIDLFNSTTDCGYQLSMSPQDSTLCRITDAIAKYNGGSSRTDAGTDEQKTAMILDFPFAIKPHYSSWKCLMQKSGIVEEIPGMFSVRGHLVIHFESEDADNNVVNRMTPPRPANRSIPPNMAQGGVASANVPGYGGAGWGALGGNGAGGNFGGYYQFGLTGGLGLG